MKGRTGVSASNTDLLVCFPSRAHLALMPKPIRSPSRPADSAKRCRSRPSHRGQSTSLFRSTTGEYSGRGAAAEEITDEPTSPTVTCAGQIKVRPRPGPKPAASSSRESRGWLSVVEDIEKLQSKKPLMQLLGALRSLRFDLHCFGSFHGAVDCSTDEEDGAEEEEAEYEVEEVKDLEGSNSKTIFSKWFMLLEDNQSHELKKEMKKEDDRKESEEEEELAPPPNALLLMRCRSAPAQGRTVIEQVEEDFGAEMAQKKEKEKKDRLLLMSYDPDFAKISTEIAKETWVVGNFDPLGRSRSWKR